MPLDPAELQEALARTAADHGPGLVGLVLVRYERPDGTVAYGHHGGVPGYTTMALRTTGGRAIVLCQNGIDLHDILTSQSPFFDAALAAG
jgi:hypothetical protein